MSETTPEPPEPEDSLDCTPRMAVEISLRDLDKWNQEPRGEPSKALIIFLWDDDGQYNTRFANAGMKTSEMVALCEIMKDRFLGFMRLRESEQAGE